MARLAPALLLLALLAVPSLGALPFPEPTGMLRGPSFAVAHAEKPATPDFVPDPETRTAAFDLVVPRTGDVRVDVRVHAGMFRLLQVDGPDACRLAGGAAYGSAAPGIYAILLCKDLPAGRYSLTLTALEGAARGVLQSRGATVVPES